MTKTKTSLTLRVVALALIVLLTGSRNQPDESFIDHLKTRLKQYFQDYPVEKTYVITDRFVYKPGEDLWFKGVVVSSAGNPLEPNSEDFFIKLLNGKGEEIISRRYPLAGNLTSGRLLIPRTTIPGRYWLIAYTGWMKNQCLQEAFRKEILVSKYYEKRFTAEINYENAPYYYGDTLKANIKILDPAGKPIPEAEFEYVIGSLTHREIKGNGETDQMGLLAIHSIIPRSEEILVLTIDIRSRKFSGDYTSIIPAVTVPPEIYFYPEGGNLVKGISNIMAFRATREFGQPANVTGEIIDHKGNVIQLVNTNANGTGRFEYLPGNDTCFLRLTKPSGTIAKYPLPLADSVGWVMHCNRQDTDTVQFTLTSRDNRQSNVSYWVATMGQNIVWSDVIPFEQSTYVTIPVRNLDDGILQVSVFNQNHQLAADRLVKIQHTVSKMIIKTDHKVYHSRQRVNLSLELTGESKWSNLAMLVSLQQLSNNKVNPGLGEINYSNRCDSALEFRYIPDALSDMDLLTTHYRTIIWNEILTGKPSGEKFKRNDGITGSVYDKKDNLTQHAKVRVTHIPNYRSYETQTDETGTFHIDFGSDIVDFNYLNVDAYDPLGKVNLIASIDQRYAEELRSILIGKGESDNKQKTMDALSYGDPDLIYALRYGPGKFRKSIRETNKKYDPNQYTDFTDVLEIIQEIQPYTIVNNSIVFRYEGEHPPGPAVQEGAIIVINGALKGTKIEILKNLLPSDITNINISASLLDVHKYTPINFEGVIEITTIQGMYKYRQPTVQLGMDILNTNRVFYSPDYSIESTTSGDNRKTLYWNPQLILQSGQSALVSFYTSDIKGIYYGRIEGIDDTGNPVQAEFSFVVE